MRWGKNVAHMDKIKNAQKISVGKPEGNGHLGDLLVDDEIILKWFLKNWSEN
jgi:hypothetical protein